VQEGNCAFGDHCPYAHNVFEYWLHPTRYRTQLCNDGSNCRRKICFFAHSLDELRVPACKPFVSPEALAGAAAAAASDSELRQKLGSVGSPIAGTAGFGPGTPRGSFDSPPRHGAAGAPEPIRMSSELGSPMHAAMQGPSFDSQEQHLIELVTIMLSQEKITAPQAAAILQQTLPSGSLQLLHSRLLVPSTSSEEPAPRWSDPLGLQAPASYETRRSDSQQILGPDRVGLFSRHHRQVHPGLTTEQFTAMADMRGTSSEGSKLSVASPRVSMDYGGTGLRRSTESDRSSFEHGKLASFFVTPFSILSLDHSFFLRLAAICLPSTPLFLAILN
jgi:hypothetical protein